MFLPLQSQNQNAEIAQLVEHDLAKVGVASSSLVFRSEGFRIFRDPFSYMGSDERPRTPSLRRAGEVLI